MEDRNGQDVRMDRGSLLLQSGVRYLTACWMFLMITVFPLFAPEKYQELGNHKFDFFRDVSLGFLLPGLLMAFFGWTWNKGLIRKKNVRIAQERESRNPGQETDEIVNRFSVTDWGVVFYLSANIISFCLSDFRTEAWEGVDGWNMGLRTQLLMGAAYFLISRFFFSGEKGDLRKRMVTGIALLGGGVGTGIVFVLGILNRFDLDPLGFYRGIDEIYKIWFLSTIGQATWYSSFVCTVLPVGICLFCFYGLSPAGGKRGIRTVLGLYCVLGFMTLVTQNSDSAFAALGFLFLGLFLLCCRSLKWMERFLETLILCAASFLAVGFLQKGFAERMIPLGNLSLLFSQGKISWIVLFVGSGVYLGLQRWRNPERVWIKYSRRIQIITAAGFAAALAGLIYVIAWNTQNAARGGSYLIFDDSWGSNRGFIWKTTVRIFEEMPLMRQLFGAGPDCFYPYSYQVSSYAQQIHDFWKPDVLTNAHNEFLNLLICVGMIGVGAFLFWLAAGAVRFLRAAERNPYVLMGFLTICSYAAHNFFCYQQVCCTPFLFLITGAAEGLARESERQQGIQTVVCDWKVERGGK